jgi:hypothetical protein
MHRNPLTKSIEFSSNESLDILVNHWEHHQSFVFLYLNAHNDINAIMKDTSGSVNSALQRSIVTCAFLLGPICEKFADYDI